MNLGRLIARVAVGGLFVGHGTQKLFGWFGGPGPEGTAQMMDKLELKPPRRNAIAAGAAETAGGGMLALGALTPVSGAVLIGSMITAIRKVHLTRGFWNTSGGYEFNIALIAFLVALIDSGPGSPSVDERLGLDRSGSAWALAALAAGAVGSTLTIEAGARADEEPAVSANGAGREGQVPAGSTA